MANYLPEPSEHLGLVVPTRGALVRGKTFELCIPITVYDALASAAPGESYTFHCRNGWKWTVTISKTGDQVVFINDWKTGSRSFIIDRYNLV